MSECILSAIGSSDAANITPAKGRMLEPTQAICQACAVPNSGHCADAYLLNPGRLKMHRVWSAPASAPCKAFLLKYGNYFHRHHMRVASPSPTKVVVGRVQVNCASPAVHRQRSCPSHHTKVIRSSKQVH